MSLIDELRREGEIFQAYEMAKDRLKAKPEQNLVKQDLARVLTDLLQKNCYLVQSTSFFEYLKEFFALNIPKRDSVIHENIMWQVGKFIKELTRAEAPSETFDQLYDYIIDVELPSGTSLFTFIVSSVLETKDLNDSYIKVLLKHRVRHLPPNHFEAINEDGEKKPSLGELLLLTLAKHLTHQKNSNSSEVKILLEELDFVGEHYTNIPFIDYYKAKAYIALDDLEKAEEAILSYLRKRSKEHLAWELLSDILSDQDKKIQALCKTVICHAHPGQLLRSQIKLFYFLLKEKEFVVAKYLHQFITNTQRELGKGSTEEWRAFAQESWYKNANREISVSTYCYNRSKEIVAYVFKDWKAQNGIIYGLNLAKDLAEFVVADDVHGAFKYFGDKNLKIGDFVQLKLQRVANHEGAKYKALHVEKSEKRPKRTIYKVVEDAIAEVSGVHCVGSVPINFSFAASKGYKLGDVVRVKAVKLPSSRFKENAKWKVLSMRAKKDV